MFRLKQLPLRLRNQIKVVGNCWVWQGCLLVCGNRQGYGRATFKRRSWLTHRLVYSLLVGDIPPPLTLDHLIESGVCTDTRCCFPPHLEVVTSKVNTLRGNSICANNARKSYCNSGHLLEGKNLRISFRFNKSGTIIRTLRVCRECNRLRMADFHLRHPRRKVGIEGKI